MEIVREAISGHALDAFARMLFGDMVKGVVDIDREIMALGAELHSDEEAALIEDGSRQQDLWGINIYPARPPEERIEFDSMINLRPAQGNRSRDIVDPEIRRRIRIVVDGLIRE